MVSRPPKDFHYGCTLCGQCCSGIMKVFLNPRDLHVLAKHLGCDHTDCLYEKGLILDDEGQQGIPWPRMRFRGTAPGFCQFVQNHWDEETGLRALCSLQDKAKPLICRLAPVTRHLDFEAEREDFTLTPPVEGCPGFLSSQLQTGDEYLAPLREELDLERRFFALLKGYLDRGSVTPEELGRYFHFSVDSPFEEILIKWEDEFSRL